jgi:hypothetical protein
MVRLHQRLRKQDKTIKELRLEVRRLRRIIKGREDE